MSHQAPETAGLQLKEVVPWGRNIDEYTAMFELTAEDLASSIADVGGGPASFNAEATTRGVSVVSLDPIYAFEAAAIRQRIEETKETIVEGCRRNAALFHWDVIPDPEALARVRLAAMDDFLADFEAGRAAGRYVRASLPRLPLRDGAVDLALCSHLLFLYSDQLGPDFHVASAAELLRVAREVRIYPLLTLAGVRSPLVGLVEAEARRLGASAKVQPVRYRFQRGAEEMLVLRR